MSRTPAPGARVRDRTSRASVSSPARSPGPPGAHRICRGTSATATAARLPATRRGPATRSPVALRSTARWRRTKTAGRAPERPRRQIPEIDHDQLEPAALDEDVRGAPRGGDPAAAADPEEATEWDAERRGRGRIETVRPVDEGRPGAAPGDAGERPEEHSGAAGGARADQLRDLTPGEAPVEERVERGEPRGDPRPDRGARGGRDSGRRQKRGVHRRCLGRRSPGRRGSPAGRGQGQGLHRTGDGTASRGILNTSCVIWTTTTSGECRGGGPPEVGGGTLPPGNAPGQGAGTRPPYSRTTGSPTRTGPPTSTAQSSAMAPPNSRTIRRSTPGSWTSVSGS